MFFLSVEGDHYCRRFEEIDQDIEIRMLSKKTRGGMCLTIYGEDFES